MKRFFDEMTYDGGITNQSRTVIFKQFGKKIRRPWHENCVSKCFKLGNGTVKQETSVVLYIHIWKVFNTVFPKS